MVVLTLARKPLLTAVAPNVLQHGSGGLNIDQCRINPGEHIPGGGNGKAHHKGSFAARETNGTRPVVQAHEKGRWPANLILEHKPECECVGTTEVQTAWSSKGMRSGTADRTVYGNLEAQNIVSKHCDENGQETISQWHCHPSCPVKELDRQSLEGGMHSAGVARDKKMVKEAYVASSYHVAGPLNMFRLGDSGGASRFFKQVGGGS